MTGTRLELTDVHAGYPGRPVLRGVSLAVREGEFLGLIGPNGVGKTTLLRVAAGLLVPDRGHARLGGRPVQGIPRRELARQVAVVGQAAPASFGLTAWEVVLLGRLPHLRRFQREGPRDLQAAAEAMRLTGTEKLRDRRVDRLSGGEAQRVQLTRALAQEPEILLLDEPTAHLDIGHQVEFLDLLLRLNRERRLTIVASLHDLNLAAQYCRRLVLLEGGRVRAAGTPEEVLTEPILASTYGTPVRLGRHPVQGTPAVHLLARYQAPKEAVFP
ncbi:ABC transporter ATP-binding protein [Limnochorda pilosa]|uniref:ABC transporter n=1 Tax=Limnochorda pilosa TaxID=1555112 RepID=A0A0K2SQP8_LIMPI|nr:ABC transporter ATP-binding protein [Limnochorda pilosa]BAS29322.1 ABC transporter [Limnochorda pilosa]